MAKCNGNVTRPDAFHRLTQLLLLLKFRDALTDGIQPPLTNMHYLPPGKSPASPSTRAMALTSSERAHLPHRHSQTHRRAL